MEALDGNAVGGMLYDVFGGEMTMAQTVCGHCETRGRVAECEVYLGGPGVVIRCRVCHSVLIVLVEKRGMTCVDLGGLSALERSAGARDGPRLLSDDGRWTCRPGSHPGL